MFCSTDQSRRLSKQRAQLTKSGTSVNQRSYGSKNFAPYEKENSAKLSNFKYQLSKLKDFSYNGMSRQQMTASQNTAYTTALQSGQSISKVTESSMRNNQKFRPNSHISQVMTTNNHYPNELSKFSENATVKKYDPRSIFQKSWRNPSKSPMRRSGKQLNSMKRFDSQLRMSGRSFKTTQSSPERLVNIVCPSQQSTQKPVKKSRRARSALKQSKTSLGSINFNSAKMTRHGYSSFNNKAARTIKDYGNQYNMANRSNSSLERIHQNHTTGNPIETPLRRKSKHSQSRSNSKSAHRLRLSQRPSSMTLSMTKSQKQLSEQNINRVVKKNEVRRTRNNALKKSLKSNGSSLSHHDRSERMNSRDLARTIKYQKNQKLNSNHFGIQDALYTMDPIPDLKG